MQMKPEIPVSWAALTTQNEEVYFFYSSFTLKLPKTFLGTHRCMLKKKKKKYPVKNTAKRQKISRPLLLKVKVSLCKENQTMR